MGCQCQWGSNECEKLTRVLIIIGSLYLIAVGVLRFILGSELKFQQFLLSAYYM